MATLGDILAQAKACRYAWMIGSETIKLDSIWELKELVDDRVMRSYTGPKDSDGNALYQKWEWTTPKEMLTNIVDCWHVTLNWYSISSIWVFNDETYEYLITPAYSRMAWYDEHQPYNVWSNDVVKKEDKIFSNTVKESGDNYFNNLPILILPVWLIARLVLRWIGKIKIKRLRIVCYILLFFVAAYIGALLDDAWRKFCYKWHCA